MDLLQQGESMNTLNNPTKEQVKEFCREIEEQLLKAIDRGSNITLGMGQKVKELHSPEYGQAVVDVLCIGAKFKAEFTERGFQ